MNVNTWIAVVLMFGSIAPSFASEIDGSCMASFAVKDKTFNSGFATLSCRDLEARRLDLFKRITAIPSSGNLDVAPIVTQLTALESKLKALEDDTDWDGWATNITGNGLATLGLASCAETLGTGCAIAAISKVLSVVGLIQTGVSDANKAQQARIMRSTIASIRTKLAGTITPASALRDQMVTEANQICVDVKANCLK